MINLMFCGNQFDGVLIALLSILKHTNEELTVYMLTMDLTDIKEKYKPITQEQAELAEKILKKKNKNNKFILIDCTKLYKDLMKKNKNSKTHYTPYIFLRLFSDKIKELPDKVLYLDSDLVIYKDIKEVYDYDVTDYDIACSRDFLGRFFINAHYKNSGVLLMNLKRMRKNKCLEKAREMCMNRKMALPDQTALNESCEKILELPDNCNEQNKRKEDTIIRHFSMRLKWFPYPGFQNYKPWHVDDVHKHYKIFDYDDIIEEWRKVKNEQ